MTLLDTVELEFITPCFCAGATPSAPEIRPASIRAEFRRWLRIMGADLATESRIMGSAAGDTGNKSLITFRVSNIRKAPLFTDWKKWNPIPSGNNGYLSFFLKKQGKECLSPGTKFTLQALTRKPLSVEDNDLFWEAWEAMIDYGSLGARSSRGFGAWVSKENAERDDLPEPLGDDFEFDSIEINPVDQSTNRLFNLIGEEVKNLRKEKQWSGKAYSPMGYVDGNSRQKSAYIFRPVKFKGGMNLLILKFMDFYNNEVSKFAGGRNIPKKRFYNQKPNWENTPKK